jgi:thioredoxin 1
MPVLVRPNNFDTEVLQSKLPVLVDFFGERCVPCRMLRPILLDLGEAYARQLKICMFNTDKERRESDEAYEEKFRFLNTYSVMHLPTILLFFEGRLRRTLIGLHSARELLAVFAEEGLALQTRIGGQPCPDDGTQGGNDE